MHKIWKGPNGECEISVAIQNGLEGFFHRSQDSQFDQKDHCASTLSQLDSCIANSEKVAESADHTTHQTYTFGFRPMNDASSKHEPFDGKHYLKDANKFAPECYSDFLAPAIGDRDAFNQAATAFCLGMKGGGPAGQPAQQVDPDHVRPQVCPLHSLGYVFDIWWNTDVRKTPPYSRLSARNTNYIQNSLAMIQPNRRGLISQHIHRKTALVILLAGFRNVRMVGRSGRTVQSGRLIILLSRTIVVQ
jgi:hypothetical protein